MKKNLFYITFLLLLSICSSAQTKLKLNGNIGYDFISQHFIGQWGLESEHKLDIDKSISFEISQYTISYQYAFKDTNSSLLLTKDEYFQSILENQKNSFANETNYINNVFQFVRFRIGTNFYISPSVYISGRVGINFMYKGNYMAYTENYIEDLETIPEELFSGEYKGDAGNQVFFSYDLQINKILFRRIELGLGATFSPAHFYAADEVSIEIYTLHLDALYFFTTNIGMKIYFKKFNTKKI